MRLNRSFTVCTDCQSRFASIRARESFRVGQVVMLIPADLGDYRQYYPASNNKTEFEC
jgi:hypothetical protein